jgi:hypothetical protein
MHFPFFQSQSQSSYRLYPQIVLEQYQQHHFIYKSSHTLLQSLRRSPRYHHVWLLLLSYMIYVVINVIKFQYNLSFLERLARLNSRAEATTPTLFPHDLLSLSRINSPSWTRQLLHLSRQGYMNWGWYILSVWSQHVVDVSYLS